MKAVSKVVVAERQLTIAIQLHFERRDPIAVHTLVSAAQGILRDIATVQRAPHRSLLHDHPGIDPQLRKEWIGLLNQPRNYFKHADRDSDVGLLWDDSENELWLLDSVLLYLTVTKKLFLSAKVYLGWFTIKNPQLATAVAGDEVGDFCRKNRISPDDYAWFLGVIAQKGVMHETEA